MISLPKNLGFSPLLGQLPSVIGRPDLAGGQIGATLQGASFNSGGGMVPTAPATGGGAPAPMAPAPATPDAAIPNGAATSMGLGAFGSNPAMANPNAHPQAGTPQLPGGPQMQPGQAKPPSFTRPGVPQPLGTQTAAKPPGAPPEPAVQPAVAQPAPGAVPVPQPRPAGLLGHGMQDLQQGVGQMMQQPAASMPNSDLRGYNAMYNSGDDRFTSAAWSGAQNAMAKDYGVDPNKGLFGGLLGLFGGGGGGAA